MKSKRQKLREKAPKDRHIKGYQKEPFFEAFKEQGNIQGACVKLGLDRTTIYRWFDEDPEFKQKFDEVKMRYRPDLIDRLETTGMTKAMAGDAQLIKFFLQSWARETYGDKFVHEIEYKITSSLVSETLEVMRRHIPEHCPGCARPLQIAEAVVMEMQKIIEREEAKSGGRD